MKRHNPIVALSMMALCALLVTASVWASDDKIPITTTSEDARKAFLLGRDLSERLQGQESLQHFADAVAKDPNFAMAYFLAAGPQPTATQFFEMLNKAVSLVDRVSEGERLWILGFDAAVNGHTMQQEEHYKKLVAAYPNDERARNLLGTYYFGQQEFGLAVDELTKATKIAPDHTAPYNMLGYAHRALKQYGEAEKAFKKYIELIPDDPNPYDSYAELLLKIGKFDASIENYEKALKHNPNFVASYLGIATNLYLKGQHSKARATIAKMHAIARNDGERRTALFGNIVTYVDEGKIETALGEVEKLIEIAEKNNDAASLSGDFGMKANLLYESGRYDDALANWEKSVKAIWTSDLGDEFKENTRRGYLYNLGRVALKNKDLEKAKETAESFNTKAKEAQNTFQIWASHDLMGMIALQEGKHDKAIEHFEQANLQDPYVLYRLAMAYEAQGNADKAKELCTEAANWNVPTNLNFAYARSKAQKMLATAQR